MVEVHHAGEPKPRVQRHQRHPQAGEQRRRLQFGSPYPHRGPAPACRQPQRTYRPAEPGGPAGGIGDQHKVGRLRVLHIPAERDATG